MPSVILPVASESTSAPSSPNSLKSPKNEEKRNQEISSAGVDSGLHDFLPPRGAMRSPCPALNTLANHSYLPHDGCNITFFNLVTALQGGFGLSPGFALFMAIGTFTLLRRPSLAPFDLYGTARHNFIEHNASMVHDDTPAGAMYAPTDVDMKLLHQFLAKAHPSVTEDTDIAVIEIDDIVTGRIEREAESAPVDALHAELGRAEFAMVMEIFGKGHDKELSRDHLDVFLRENRFPEGWSPSHTLHLWEVVATSKQMRSAMQKVRAAGTKETETRKQCIWEWIKLAIERPLSQA